MFTHILCPTDLKERAFIALKKAVQIAHQFNARITMLNVHDEFLNKEEREMLRVSLPITATDLACAPKTSTSAARAVTTGGDLRAS